MKELQSEHKAEMIVRALHEIIAEKYIPQALELIADSLQFVAPKLLVVDNEGHMALVPATSKHLRCLKDGSHRSVRNMCTPYVVTDVSDVIKFDTHNAQIETVFSVPFAFH
tara:strand:+ start:14227 stop:14559 length:333 start_codon:yes stop_codon:yes gene_type:complete